MSNSLVSRLRKRVSAFLICSLVLASMFVVLPAFVPGEVQANPSPIIYTDLYYSQPTAHTVSGITVSLPADARDLRNATSAQFDYGSSAAGFFEVRAFKVQDVRASPLPVITQVDLKMLYNATANTQGETYQIDYWVSPSATLNSLVPATGAAFGPDTQVWAAVTEPNDGVWDWTDIGNIRIRVTTSGTAGPTESSLFKEHEAWVTVVIESSPKLFVTPANVTDVVGGKDIGSTFSVDVNVENISSLFGPEFRLRFDPKVLNVTSWTYGDLFPTQPALFQNITDNDNGLVWIAVVRNPGELAVYGSGTLVNVNFKVKGMGETTLNLYGSILGNPSAASIPHDIADGYFRNVPMPFGATLQVVAPSGLVNKPFSVNINITKSAGESGAFGVYSWEFNMTYDPSILNATLVLEGAFLRTSGTTTFKQIINQTQGWVWANSTLNGDKPGVYGNGTLATIDFKLVGLGTSALDFVPGKNRLTRYDYGTGIPGVGDGTIPPAFPNPLPGTNPFFDLPAGIVNGSVTVALFHDVDVTEVSVNKFVVKTGDVVNIAISVFNPGDYQETFDVSAFYNDTLVAPAESVTLSASARQIVNFVWNTSGVASGGYLIKANASVVPDEMNVANNQRFVEGVVRVSPLTPPVAEFAYSPSEPKVGDTVTFDASGSQDDGTIVSYVWDFGDGTVTVYVGENLTDTTTHVFTVAGTYNVTLTLEDDDGLSGSTWQLVVVKATSTLTMSVSQVSVIIGNSVTINGTLAPPKVGLTVRIYYRLGAGAWVSLANVTTNTAGQYTFSWTPGEVRTYELMADWEGDATTLPDNSTIVSVAVRKMTSLVYLNLSLATITLGSNVTITGEITPSRPSVTVTIQYKPSGGDWTNLTSVSTDASSRFSYMWKPEVSGSYELRASWLGDASTESNTSVVRALTVEAPAPFAISIEIIVVAIVVVLVVIGLVWYFLRRKKPEAPPI